MIVIVDDFDNSNVYNSLEIQEIVTINYFNFQ